MSSVSIEQPLRANAGELSIDRRSFNVFEVEGDRLLFDRATGSTSELNDLAFEVLREIRTGTPALEAVEMHCEEDAREGVIEALQTLKRRGFFRFWTVEPLSDEELMPLWEHRPRRIQLLMAEGCNLGCRYCYQWRNGTNQKHTLMPWNVARDAVNYLVWRSGQRNDLQITFFGGEPLLNYPTVRRVVNYCKSIEKHTGKEFTFELITNGTLLDKDVVDFIVEHKFLLFVSIDGWKEMHQYNRPSLAGDKDMYDTILKNAIYANEQYLKHKLPAVKVRANLTGKYHDAHAVAQYFESLGFGLIGIGAIEPLPHGNPSPAALTEEQMEELTADSWEKTKEGLAALERGERLGPYMKRKINQATTLLSKREWHGITCGVGRNTTIVDNRGNMYPCHRYAEMKAFEIGNVCTGMDREKMMAYYRKINGHSAESCQNCWIRDYCSGGCAWLLSDKDGVIHSPTNEECNRRRASMEQGLWMRARLRTKMPNRFKTDDVDVLDYWNWNDVGAAYESHACGNEPTPAPASKQQFSLPVISLAEVQSAGAPTPSSCGSCSSATTGGGCGCGSPSPLQMVEFVPLHRQKL